MKGFGHHKVAVLVWRYSFHSEDFSFVKDPKVWSLTLKSNLPEGTFGRLHSLDRFSGDDTSLDPRFVILMTSCLSEQCVSDHRQECLFEDLLEDFDDGSLVLSVSGQIGIMMPCQPFQPRKSFQPWVLTRGNCQGVFSLFHHKGLLPHPWYRP